MTTPSQPPPLKNISVNHKKMVFTVPSKPISLAEWLLFLMCFLVIWWTWRPDLHYKFYLFYAGMAGVTLVVLSSHLPFGHRLEFDLRRSELLIHHSKHVIIIPFAKIEGLVKVRFDSTRTTEPAEQYRLELSKISGRTRWVLSGQLEINSAEANFMRELAIPKLTKRIRQSGGMQPPTYTVHNYPGKRMFWTPIYNVYSPLLILHLCIFILIEPGGESHRIYIVAFFLLVIAFLSSLTIVDLNRRMIKIFSPVDGNKSIPFDYITGTVEEGDYSSPGRKVYLQYKNDRGFREDVVLHSSFSPGGAYRFARAFEGLVLGESRQLTGYESGTTEKVVESFVIDGKQS